MTKHPICDYWWGEWGMAASKKQNDYVHLVAEKLKNGILILNLMQ